MDFIGVFSYMYIVYLAQIHPITLISSSPKIATLLLTYQKNTNFYVNIYLNPGHLTSLFVCFIQFAPISL